MPSGIPPPLPPSPRGPAELRFDAAAGGRVEEKPSRLALASVVLGVLSCPFFCLTGIPGLICGVMGLRQIEASERPGSPVRYTGRSRALTGIILSGMMLFMSPVLVGTLFGDGAVRTVAQQIDAKTLRALFTRDGGEVLGAP
jgi:hypothetical protein